MRVSIIMTYHDGGFRGPMIEKTLRTIEEQGLCGHLDWEIVLVEDGDTTNPDVEQMLIDRFAGCHQYLRLHREGYNNPARAMNVGIKAAKGEYLLIQNPEVFHVGNVIANLVGVMDKAKERGERVVVFPTCLSLSERGTIDPVTPVYCGAQNARAFFFCGMVRREDMMEIGGVDETFILPSHDDDDLALRLTKGLGLQPKFLGDLHVYHAWHPRPDSIPMAHKAMRQHLDNLNRQWARGEIDHVRNKGVEWGVLE